MSNTSFQQGIKEVCAKDQRYPEDAYYFLHEALDFTVKSLKKNGNGANRHVNGGELLEGWRILAIREFGPMALTVMQTWHLERTEDIGELVFNLVETGRLGKTEKDSREDFVNGYDFYEAYAKPYEVDGLKTRSIRGSRIRRKKNN